MPITRFTFEKKNLSRLTAHKAATKKKTIEKRKTEKNEISGKRLFIIYYALGALIKL